MKLHRRFLGKTVVLCRGFTLVEMLIVVGLVALLAGVGFVVGIDAYERSTFRGQQDVLVSALHAARSRALANIGQCHHIVTTADDGSSFTLTAEDRTSASVVPCQAVAPSVFELDGDMRVTTSTEVVFIPLSAEVATDKDILISFTRTGGQTHTKATVTVGSNGRIDWE